jgi:formamidopyrimidine-DNA glycosylase
VGHVVRAVRRRGKYLLLDMETGIGMGVDINQGLLLLHLGMSGSLRFIPTPLTPPTAGVHDHFDLVTTHGVLRLNDPRRFGAVVYTHNEQDPVAQKLLGHWGMEPLSEDGSDAFIFETFLQGLQASRSAIKPVLLAGRLVVGVGNIYASEALFLAGILPTTIASSIGKERAQKLYDSIRQVLHAAVLCGGSTLRNFSSADGSVGHFQQQTNVYGREAAPCHTCGTLVCMVRQAQRSTFYCPHCQLP